MNDKLGLDVLKSSSTFDSLDEYKLFLNVRFGVVSGSGPSVLLMLFDGVTIFKVSDDTMARRQSSGRFVVTRSVPLLRDSVRVLLLVADLSLMFVFLTPSVFAKISFKGISLRTLAFVFMLDACFGLREAE